MQRDVTDHDTLDDGKPGAMRVRHEEEPAKTVVGQVRRVAVERVHVPRDGLARVEIEVRARTDRHCSVILGSHVARLRSTDLLVRLDA